jgi:hypothetical protein
MFDLTWNKKDPFYCFPPNRNTPSFCKKGNKISSSEFEKNKNKRENI